MTGRNLTLYKINIKLADNGEFRIHENVKILLLHHVQVLKIINALIFTENH